MNIPKYWARRSRSAVAPDGRSFALDMWQWSNTEPADAERKAQARLDQVAAKVQNGGTLDRYGYGDRPMREEIVQEVRYNTGQAAAILTRNAYGALVLNTAAVMFIDIDLPGAEDGRAGAGETQALQGMEAFARRNAGWGMRVYRTRGGLRALVTHGVFDPARAETADLLRAFNSDPLYIRLCRAQQCFRARLTPKPWRCKAGAPPARFPFADARVEAEYRAWTKAYEFASAHFGVCRLVGKFGTEQVNPECAGIAEIHDRWTRAAESMPLA